jgi:hypothetical protein
LDISGFSTDSFFALLFYTILPRTDPSNIFRIVGDIISRKNLPAIESLISTGFLDGILSDFPAFPSDIGRILVTLVNSDAGIPSISEFLEENMLNIELQPPSFFSILAAVILRGIDINVDEALLLRVLDNCDDPTVVVIMNIFAFYFETHADENLVEFEWDRFVAKAGEDDFQTAAFCKLTLAAAKHSPEQCQKLIANEIHLYLMELISARSFCIKLEALDSVVLIAETLPNEIDLGELLALLGATIDSSVLKPILRSVLGLILRGLEEMDQEWIEQLAGKLEDTGILDGLRELELDNVDETSSVWLTMIFALLGLSDETQFPM